MSPKQNLSIEDLKSINEKLEGQSPEELQITLEKLLTSLPPEAQEAFKKMEAEAKTRPGRPQLAEISPAALRALEGEDLDLAVYEYVATRIYEADDQRATLLTLPRGLQVFYLTFLVEVEVMNGGFNQFFWNPSSEMAELIAPALRELQADEAAVIFEQALKTADTELSTQPKFKTDRSIEQFSKSYAAKELNKFDNGFCRLAERFPALRAKFIRTHEQQFLSVPR